MIKLLETDLTALQKREVKSEFLKYSELCVEGQVQLELFSKIIKNASLLVNSPSVKKKNLSIFIIAISIYIGLPQKLTYHCIKDKYLVAALMYFMDPDDVIPDHVPYIGFNDDAYFVELALEKASVAASGKVFKIAELISNYGLEHGLEVWQNGAI